MARAQPNPEVARQEEEVARYKQGGSERTKHKS